MIKWARAVPARLAGSGQGLLKASFLEGPKLNKLPLVQDSLRAAQNASITGFDLLALRSGIGLRRLRVRSTAVRALKFLRKNLQQGRPLFRL